MNKSIIKILVRTRFALTSKNRASNQIRKMLHDYLALGHLIDAQLGSQKIFVPPIQGVDEDMRNWSFFMILEHNIIVNRCITSIIQSLVRGEHPTGEGAIDPKSGVMPSENPGEDQIHLFRESIENHLKVIPRLNRLRGGFTQQHPLFGKFNAHYWHCTLPFHLQIHYKQAKYVVQKISEGKGK